MAGKIIKVKVKKRKIRFKRIFIALLILALLYLGISYYLHLPVKNIYITGNEILKDKEIISLSKLDNYPPFINTYFMDIKNELLKNDYIKDVKVTRKFFNKI